MAIVKFSPVVSTDPLPSVSIVGDVVTITTASGAYAAFDFSGLEPGWRFPVTDEGGEPIFAPGTPGSWLADTVRRVGDDLIVTLRMTHEHWAPFRVRFPDDLNLPEGGTVIWPA